MGNCGTHDDNFDSTVGLSRSHFTFHYPIGKGGFGKVWKVQMKSTKVLYAMKEMRKDRVIVKKSVGSVMNERKLLTVLKHPFIVNMHFAFQDRENLYLGMDLLTGGDLRYHISLAKRFSEEQARFFIAAILVALEYIHANNIIHRDLKPENMVMDANGYIRITDFGIARAVRSDNSADTSGTPGYMSPEVICRSNHTLVSDFFAVGVMVHELMIGRRPYLGKTRKEVRDAILARQVVIHSNEVPEGWSLQSADFCNRLLQRKPSSRLGSEGMQEVKGHDWFRGFDWGRLEAKTLPSPYIPSAGENFDTRLARQEWKDDEQAMAIALKQPGIQSFFEGYFYDEKIGVSSDTHRESHRDRRHMLPNTI